MINEPDPFVPSILYLCHQITRQADIVADRGVATFALEALTEVSSLATQIQDTVTAARGRCPPQSGESAALTSAGPQGGGAAGAAKAATGGAARNVAKGAAKNAAKGAANKRTGG